MSGTNVGDVRGRCLVKKDNSYGVGVLATMVRTPHEGRRVDRWRRGTESCTPSP